MGKENTYWRQDERPAAKRLQQLDGLCRISRALSVGADRQGALCHVLDILDREFGLNRGTITLLAPDGKQVRIEAVHNLSQQKSRSITYRVGEGVTGRVMETGKAAIVARGSREPLFLNRFERWNVTKQELSFICMPISVGDDVIGTISADRPFDQSAPLDEEVRILGIVASMIANDLRARRQAVAERQELADENLRLRRELGERFQPASIVGSSNAMRDVCHQIQQLALCDEAVLIRGECGTGKELVAHAIHYSSSRTSGPFARVDCSAINEELLESELFGRERDASDGRIRSRRGRLEEASGGTLLLDEIGDLSAAMQVKLLRLLQERRFERIGGDVTIETNARIIATTNRALEKAVDEGSFRPDLYHRVSAVAIMLPPLKERNGDILLLANHFVEQYSKKTGKVIRRISTSAIEMMVAYHWPGNVRELEDCIERAVRLSEDAVVHAHHLPPTLQTSDGSDTAEAGSFKERVGLFERDLIVDALKRCNGNLAATARDLKATARIVRHRVKELGIDYKRYCGKRG